MLLLLLLAVVVVVFTGDGGFMLSCGPLFVGGGVAETLASADSPPSGELPNDAGADIGVAGVSVEVSASALRFSEKSSQVGSSRCNSEALLSSGSGICSVMSSGMGSGVGTTAATSVISPVATHCVARRRRRRACTIGIERAARSAFVTCWAKRSERCDE